MFVGKVRRLPLWGLPEPCLPTEQFLGGVFHEADMVTAPANIPWRIYRIKAEDLAAGKQPEGLRIGEGSWWILELTEQYCFYEDWPNGEVHRMNLAGTQDIVIEGADLAMV